MGNGIIEGEYKPMSTQISDNDGGWWNTVGKGYGVHGHIEHSGKVISTVDIVVITGSKNITYQERKRSIQRQLGLTRRKNRTEGYKHYESS